MPTTVGRLLVDSALPDGVRGDRVMTSDVTDAVLASVASTSPDKYRDVSRDLVQLGREAAFAESATLSLSDLEDDHAIRDGLAAGVRKQLLEVDRLRLPEADKKRLRAEVLTKIQGALVADTYSRAVGRKNPLALQVLSKARGNPQQLTAMLATPGVYTDAKNEIVPVFIERSYAEGLRPHEYWASTYGARKSVIGSKFSVREGGYLGKQFNQASMRTIVTADDCETPNGVPFSTDDNDSIGAELARRHGDIPAGTVITKSVLAQLKTNGFKDAVIRSPITCGMGQGVCKHCVGLREDGKFPDIGAQVGLNAASALAERVAQGALNTKHSGGMAKGDEGAILSGFPIVDALMQSPKTMPHRAAVAELDGKIDAVEPAPQGGSYIRIGDNVHYALPDSKILVKPGDSVEAGDQLSSGLLDPRDVVQYKGLGEGRRYFAERATQAFRDSGYQANRRNVELLARGLIDHVVVDADGAGDYMPGDVAAYSAMAYSYRPRPTSKRMPARSAVGTYLEQPALHYSIGTRVTPAVAKQLEAHDIGHVVADPSPPAFHPEYVGLRSVPQYDKDWMARLGSSYLKTNLLEQAHVGGVSDTAGLHPTPVVARGIGLPERGRRFARESARSSSRL